MPLGGSQKPRINWWHSVSTGRNWFSAVKANSNGQPASEAIVKTHAKPGRRHAKG